MGDSGQWLHHLAVPQKIYRSKIMAVTIADIIAGLPVAWQKKNCQAEHQAGCRDGCAGASR